MHTVFINTTGNERNAIDYSSRSGGRGDSAGLDVLKYEIQFKKLKYVNCSLKNWNDEKLGYKKAIRDVSRYIDTYNGVGNDYNLIIYADMREFAEYAGLSLTSTDDIVKTAVFDAYTQMAVRLFMSTIYTELCDAGRQPASKFLLLLERPDYNYPSYVREKGEGSEYSAYELAMIDVTLELLGILPYEQLAEKTEALKQNGGKKYSVEDFLMDKKTSADFSFREIYGKQIEVFLRSLVKEETDTRKQCAIFCRTLNRLFELDTKHDVGVSEYCTNRRIQSLSLEASRKRSLLLQFFIWDCVNTKTLYNCDKDESGDPILVPKRIIEPTDAEWSEVLKMLAAKKKLLELRGQMIENNDKNHIEMGYAPPLYTPDYEKFGIDESGYPDKKWEIRQLSAEELKKKAKKKKKKKKKGEENGKTAQEGAGGDIDTDRDKLELAETKRKPTNWLETTEYELYGRIKKDFQLLDPAKPIMEEYKNAALSMANSSLSIIGTLNTRISKNMSRYSSTSTEKNPAFLRKRRVKAGEKVTERDKNDYIYAEKKNNTPVISDDPIDTVMRSAPIAYKTVVLDYLGFESGRGIELKNAKDTCEKFINRMDQIDASMKKAIAVLGVLAALLLALYVPFLLIQWEAIFENFNTFLIALISLFIPVLSLVFGYIIARFIQKREIDAAWDKLKKDCEMIDDDNDTSIRAYDRLLTWHIPSLRWIYEYLLDIDFHHDCLKTADARISHHVSVLNTTKEIIGNILEDLDFDETTVPEPALEDEVDYSTSPYEGGNYPHYSIVDKDIIKKLFG